MSEGLRRAVAALRHRDFAVFWSGALLSNTGGWIQRASVPFVIFEMTESASWVGLVSFLQFLPSVLLGPVGGWLADRHSRRSVLLSTQAAMGLSATALWLLFTTDSATPATVTALVVVHGVFGGLNLPSWQAFVSELVPRRDLLNAITLNSAQFNAAKALGPAIAGVLLATWGPAEAFLFNAGSYVFVLAALLAIPPRAAAAGASPARRLLGDLAATVRHVRSRPGMARAVTLVMVLGLTGGPLFTLLKVFADEVFVVGDTTYGVMGASIGLGAILGAPLVAGWGSLVPRSRLARVGLTGYGTAVLVFALAPHVTVAIVALLVVGTCHLTVASTLNTTLQVQVDDHRRGKVMALHLMGLTGSIPVGSLVQGVLADVVGPRPTVATAGALLVGSVAWLSSRPGGFSAMDDDGDMERQLPLEGIDPETAVVEPEDDGPVRTPEVSAPAPVGGTGGSPPPGDHPAPATVAPPPRRRRRP